MPRLFKIERRTAEYLLDTGRLIPLGFIVAGLLVLIPRWLSDSLIQSKYVPGVVNVLIGVGILLLGGIGIGLMVSQILATQSDKTPK